MLAGPPKQIFLADFPRLSSSWHSVQWTPATFVTHHIPHPELSAQCPQLHEVHREPLQFPLPQLAWKLTQGYKLEPSEGSPVCFPSLGNQYPLCLMSSILKVCVSCLLSAFVVLLFQAGGQIQFLLLCHGVATLC